MNAADGLRAAADVLTRHGWIQNSYGTRDRGFCLVGALDQVVVHREIPVETEQQMYARLAEVIGSNRVVSWNDRRDRTKTEVVAALRQAAERADTHRSDG